MTAPEEKRKPDTEPITDQYQKLMKNFIEKSKDYQMKILGPLVVNETPLLFWEASTAQKLGYSLTDWRQRFSNRERGLEIAVFQINTMIQVIERHHQEQYRAWKARQDKQKNDATNKGK